MIVFVVGVLVNAVAIAIGTVLWSPPIPWQLSLVWAIVVGAGLALWRRHNDARPLHVRVDDAAVLIGRAAGAAPVPWGRVAVCDVVEPVQHRRALVVMGDAAAGPLGNVATMPSLLARVAALAGRAPAGPGWCGSTRCPTPRPCWSRSASPPVGDGPSRAPS